MSHYQTCQMADVHGTKSPSNKVFRRLTLSCLFRQYGNQGPVGHHLSMTWSQWRIVEMPGQ